MKTEVYSNGVTDGDKRQATFSKLHLPFAFVLFLAGGHRDTAVLWRYHNLVQGCVEVTKGPSDRLTHPMILYPDSDVIFIHRR